MKTTKLVGIAVAVAVSICCVLGVIVQAVGGNATASTESTAISESAPTATVMPSATMPAPTATVEPTATIAAPTATLNPTETVLLCKVEIVSWSAQLTPLFEEAIYLEQYIKTADGENGFAMADMIVKQMNSITPPACDEAAVSIHNGYTKAMETYRSGFLVVNSDVQQAIVYFTDANAQLSAVVKDLQRLIVKYSA